MNSFSEHIEIITSALQKAGYDPHAQLQGYLSTGDLSYITRRDNARTLAAQLDKDELRTYLQKRK